MFRRRFSLKIQLMLAGIGYLVADRTAFRLTAPTLLDTVVVNSLLVRRLGFSLSTSVIWICCDIDRSWFLQAGNQLDFDGYPATRLSFMVLPPSVNLCFMCCSNFVAISSISSLLYSLSSIVMSDGLQLRHAILKAAMVLAGYPQQLKHCGLKSTIFLEFVCAGLFLLSAPPPSSVKLSLTPSNEIDCLSS